MISLARVQSVQKLSARIYLVRLERDSSFAFAAGQHLKLHLGLQAKGPKALAPGYFSIASAPEAPWVDLIVRGASDRLELIADFLVQARPGQEITIEGPFGNFGYRPSPQRHVWLIAQGTGIAPLLSIARSKAFLESLPLSTSFLVGFRDEADQIDFESMGLPRSSCFVTLSSPTKAWGGLRGRVTDQLKAGGMPILWAQTEFYLCGSAEMLWDVKSILAAHGVVPASVHSD